jgi:D-alanyl-D-alanine carboxypeptidase
MISKSTPGVAQSPAPGFSIDAVGPHGVVARHIGVSNSFRGNPLTPEASFPLGCLIKPILSLVALEAWSQGLLDLDARISEYIGELRGTQGELLTVRHLLSHTSGVVEPADTKLRSSGDWQSLVALYSAGGPVFTPGSVWSYSQTGHILVGRVLERVMDRPPIELAFERVLGPLGIEGLGLGRRPDAGNRCVTLHSFAKNQGRFVPILPPEDTELFRNSVSDICITGRSLRRLGGAIAAAGLFSQTVIDAFRTPAVTTPKGVGPSAGERVPTAYGLGCGHYGQVLGHNGSLIGATCSLRFSGDGRTSVAVMINAWNPILRDDLIRQALKETSAIHLPEVDGEECREQQLDDFVGNYTGLMFGLGAARFERQGADYRLLVSEPTGGVLPIAFRRSANGVALAQESRRAPRVAFARTPDAGEPYLLVGMSAYARA